MAGFRFGPALPNPAQFGTDCLPESPLATLCTRLVTPGSSDRTVYLGLCSTYHDPALALADANGQVLFAEATERYLQTKRALNCDPDHP